MKADKVLLSNGSLNKKGSYRHFNIFVTKAKKHKNTFHHSGI